MHSINTREHMLHCVFAALVAKQPADRCVLLLRYNEVKAAVREAEANPADGDKIPAEHGDGKGLAADGSAPTKLRIAKVQLAAT